MEKKVSRTALVASVLILTVAGVAVFAISKAGDAVGTVVGMPERLAGRLADAVRPNVKVIDITTGTFGKIEKTPKLVVLTSEVNISIEKRKETRIIWEYIGLGETAAELKVTGNKVQHYIPLNSVTPDNFAYDDQRRILTITLPAPVLDEEVVDVQSNPDQYSVRKEGIWTTVGAGADLIEQARRELRQKVIEEGRHELLMDKAKVEGEKVVRQLFAPLIESVRDDVRVDVEFQ